MIKINLLGEENQADTSATVAVGGYVASLAVIIIGFFMAYYSASGTVEELTERSENLNRQLTRLKELTKEVKDLEAKKKSLQEKLVVIATLQRSKTGPVRVMADLNGALPEKSWVTEVKESGGVFRLTGMALDNQTIADFMKDLDLSDYFDTVDLIETRQALKDKVKMKSFLIQTKVNYAGAMQAPAEVPAASSSAPSTGGKS